MRFTKMQGIGNDYVYVNCLEEQVENPSSLAKIVSDRHFGIGSDGLILIRPSAQADFFMEMFNADGSRSEMCGNGIRCVGKYVFDHGLTSKTEIDVNTLAGVKHLVLHVEDERVASVTVDMGEPALKDETQFVESRNPGYGTFVSMGNPHYVIFTNEVDQVSETGQMLEHHLAFPKRCNIEFAHVEDDGSIRTRVWERGSGVTQACGTGACATAVAATLTGRVKGKSQIVMDGGSLSIEWRKEDNHVYMTGPAEFVFDGELELAKLQTT